jgi:hypothetical protein
MRRIRWLLLYFAAVFAGGALLAPWLYWLVQWAAHRWPALAPLAASPFPRFLDRSLLGLALLGLWPLLRLGGIRSWNGLGFVKQKHIARRMLGGFALGWASLAAAALLALVFGGWSLVTAHSAAEACRCLLNAACAAVAVAVLEEIVFRGALFGLLRQSLPWPAALAASSAIYSAVHFLKKVEIAGPVQWDSGLNLLWTMLRHPPPLIPAFLTLFMAGALLALAYQRTGALYVSIGLHAGWIFWLKTCAFVLRPPAAAPSLWGGGNLVDSWLSLVILAVLFAAACAAPKWAAK